MTVEQALAQLEQTCNELADFAEQNPDGFEESIRQATPPSTLCSLARTNPHRLMRVVRARARIAGSNPARTAAWRGGGPDGRGDTPARGRMYACARRHARLLVFHTSMHRFSNITASVAHHPTLLIIIIALRAGD